MPKRKRKTISSSRKRKPNSKIIQAKPIDERNTDDDRSTGNDEEAWILNELVSFDTLRGDAAPSCDTEGCKLKALYIYEGQQSKSLWKSCIDCQLNDYEVWPTMAECNDATNEIPFTSEMEILVRNKCSNKSNILFPSHISSRNNVERLGKIVLSDTPTLREDITESNNKSSNESIDSNSVATLIIPEDELNDAIECTTQQETIQSEDIVINTNGNNKFKIINNIVRTNTLYIIEDTTATTSVVSEEDNVNGNIDENSVKKRQDKSRKEFSYELKQLERKGEVYLSPKVINKATGSYYEHGMHITCLICKRFRTNTDANINLRRQYYDYYFYNHIKNTAHITAKSLFDR